MMARRSGPVNSVEFIMGRQIDGCIKLKKQFIRDKLDFCRIMDRMDLFSHYGCVNAIEFSKDGQLLLSGGDDRRVLLWQVDEAVHGRCNPNIMRAQHISNIFCLAYDSTNSKVFSGGNDDQVIVHDTKTGDPSDYFMHEQPVYGLSIDPSNDNIFASACDDGRVLIYDLREKGERDHFCLATFASPFHGVMFNPMEPRYLATANSKEGVGLWDIRRPRHEVLRYGGGIIPQSCMSVRFNQAGTQILALRRRLPPVLYQTHDSKSWAQFDHPGYYNSCTMKSCSFAGANDEYVLSGSDDFNLYMWRVPVLDKFGQWVPSAHMVLKGHRSIVNQVRYNSSHNIIASSGVEKIVKFWSPFHLPGSENENTDPVDDPGDNRRVFTHEEYIRLVLESGQFMSHDYSHESTQEDPRMMAFFDSLVQREIEGWSSEASVHSTDSVHGDRDAPANVVQSSASSDSDTRPLDPVDEFNAQLRNVRRNGANISSEPSSSNGAQAPNRITLLIAKKREQLMRLAHGKGKMKIETKLQFSSNSASSTTSSSDSSSSSTEEDWGYRAGVSNSYKRSFKRKWSRTKRNTKQKLSDLSSSNSSSESSEEQAQKSKKRLKSSSENKKKSPVPNHSALKITTKTTNYLTSSDDTSDWDKPGKSSKGKKYSATPDSGIDLSQTNGSTKPKTEKFTKMNKNRLKRNYRNRVTSESDSD